MLLLGGLDIAWYFVALQSLRDIAGQVARDATLRRHTSRVHEHE